MRIDRWNEITRQNGEISPSRGTDGLRKPLINLLSRMRIGQAIRNFGSRHAFTRSSGNHCIPRADKWWIHSLPRQLTKEFYYPLPTSLYPVGFTLVLLWFLRVIIYMYMNSWPEFKNWGTKRFWRYPSLKG